MSDAVAQQISTMEAEPTRQVPTYQPRFDIVETEQELTLYGDLPGVDESHLDIRYENEQLTIHGDVPLRHEGVNFARREYGVGDFYRTFRIGESIDAEKISAELDHGVLVVHLPKSPASKPRRIEVKTV
jgi:HSP20 family molecular chaperone IbpA